MDYHDPYPAQQPRNLFDQAMSRLNLDLSMIEKPDLIIRSNEHACLNTEDPNSALNPILCKFDTVDDVKELIGFNNEIIENGQMPQPPIPREEWSLGTDFDRETLCCENLTNLQQAAYAYVYGNSNLISLKYKNAINYYYQPFEIAVYAGCNLVIEPGAELEVDGKPAFLLFDHIDIRDGGHITLKTQFNISSNLLFAKKEA
jgi:hypothetical protein